MPVKTNVKNSNLYSTYSIPNNYKVLTNTDNKKLDLLYKNWKNNSGYSTLNNFYKSELNKINLLLKFIYTLKDV